MKARSAGDRSATSAAAAAAAVARPAAARATSTLAAAAAPAATTPRGCTAIKLRELTRLVTRDYDAQVVDRGMKVTQYSLLKRVVEDGPVRPSDLAARTRLDASTLTRNLRPLEASGWVAVIAGPDARSRFVVATDAGRAQCADAQGAWKRAQLELNGRLGIDRVNRLHAMIDECLELLEAERHEGA